MPEVWPLSLPFFDRADGHSRTGPQNAVIRTQMDTGPAKVRRRTTLAPKIYSGIMRPLTKAEFATFEAFFEDTIAAGSLSFHATDEWDGVLKEFRFVGTYTMQPAGVRAAVSAELEILGIIPSVTEYIGYPLLGQTVYIAPLEIAA